MPLLVTSEELRPGMRLSEPLSSNGRVLLKGDRPLSPADISALQRRFSGLSLRVGDPLWDEVIEFEDDANDRYVAETAQHMVSEAMSHVQLRICEQISDGSSGRQTIRASELGVVHSAIEDLMQFLDENPTSAALISSCLERSTYLAAHTGNVLFLSMLLGAKVLDYVVSERKRQTKARDLGYYAAQDLAPLGLGAMTMDLGLMPYQALYTSSAPLSEDDRKTIRQHPSAGADMLPESFSAIARMIVRTHHENFDGSGYPSGLDGNKLHIFTRIVRIADAFDAATSQRVYADARSPARVLWEMLAGPYRRFFDPRLMAPFARMIQPFPIGAKLQLSDDRYALVVKYNRRNPFKPIVLVAFDEHNRPIPRESLEAPVDLSECDELRLKSYRGEDLSFIYNGESVEFIEGPQAFSSGFEAAFP